MDEKEYLNHLFDQYVQTQELLELKEEVSINLHENIVAYLKEGLNKKEAFLKAVEDLGELEQILGEFAKKKENIWKWLYYISVTSIIIGLFFGVITFLDQIGWNGAFLALGCLYPFCVVQSAYIIWYKIGKAKKTGWNNLTGITVSVFLFLIINIVESIFLEKYYYGSMLQGLENVAAEIMLAAISLSIAIYAWRKSKVNEK